MNEKQELSQEAKGQFDIPASWTWSEVKEVVKTVFDGPFGSNLKTSDYTDSGVRVIRLENLGYLNFKNDKTTYISHEKYVGLKKHTIYEGDIIVGSFIADGVKAALIPHLDDTLIAKADCFCIRHNPNAVDNRYLHYALSTGFISEGYLTIMRGVTRSRINTSQLKQTSIPLAPLPEQRRIVAKLEELFSRLDAGVAAVRRTQALLKRYRQSVLHAAVTGEFTRAWREAHPAPTETGATLLTRIHTERRAQWEAAQVAKRGGQLPLNDAWKKKYEEPEAPDTSELPELPAGWAVARLDTIADLKGGVTKDSKRQHANARSVPYLRVANVQRGYLDLAEVKKIEVPETALEDLLLQYGDVLFNEGGDLDKLGRGWIWEGQLPECTHQNHVFRARPYLSEVASRLISYWGNSFGQLYFMRVGKQTTNLASINLSKLSEFPIPLPPIAEQVEIVVAVEARLSVLDKLEVTLTDELKRAERLRQSLLHRAFTGRLVPQDATDEPAAALLTRLREAPAAGLAKAAAKGPRGRRAPAQQTTLGL